MKSTRFLYLALMIKCTFKEIDVMDQLLVVRVNIKTVILKTIHKSIFVKLIVLVFSLIRAAFLSSIYFLNTFHSQESFFVKHIALISILIRPASLVVYKNINRLLAWHIKFGKIKTLKKMISEELMPIAQHPKRWWNFCMSEYEKKEMELIFVEQYF